MHTARGMRGIDRSAWSSAPWARAHRWVACGRIYACIAGGGGRRRHRPDRDGLSNSKAQSTHEDSHPCAPPYYQTESLPACLTTFVAYVNSPNNIMSCTKATLPLQLTNCLSTKSAILHIVLQLTNCVLIQKCYTPVCVAADHHGTRREGAYGSQYKTAILRTCFGAYAD
jgi:hypothetical protein